MTSTGTTTAPAAMAAGDWLINLEPRPEAHLRLFCAHHAGGSAQYFDPWPAGLPAEFEVYGVNLPGRGLRRIEPLVRDLATIVTALADEMEQYLDRPYALFGDSIGALVSYEVIRELQRRGAPLPVRLFASGMVAPQIVWWDPDAPLHKTADAALFDGLVHDAGMLDAVSLANDELRQVMLPVLRADLEMAETYAHQPGPPLAVPITASRGDDDTLLTPEQLEGWSALTGAEFEHLTFPGAHFYSQQSQPEVLAMIADRLRSDLATRPVSVADGDAHPYPDQCLHEIFAEQAKKTPDATALVQHDKTYTYRQLDAETDALARWLVTRGVKPGDLVGILMERCPEHVVALIAINKAGGIFMPLEAAYPATTMETFIRTSEARLFLSKPALVDPMLDTLRGRCEWVTLGPGWQDELGLDDPGLADVALPIVAPDAVAFMSMSSGTSGAPKGICQSHRAAVNAYWHRYVYAPYGDDEHEACNVYFIWYVWLPLLQGAVAYIVPDDVIYDPALLVAYIEDHRITRSTISPSLLESVLRTPGLDLATAFASLRNVTIIGEVVPSTLATEFYAVAPHATLTQGYGCAETHDAASTPLAHTGASGARLPVASTGGPQMNQRMYVLDETGVPQARGVTGELYVGGPSIAEGYFRDETNTNLRFVPDPVRPEGGTMFKTGDRARMLPDGTIQVLGRIDSMVKLRGYSVMLGVVEGALLGHPAIARATVVPAIDDTTGRPDHLVAYVVWSADTDAPPAWELWRFLGGQLPHYAMPAFVVPMAALPIDASSNSKLDRRSLPEPDPEYRLTSVAATVAPRHAIDEAIRAEWVVVLGVGDPDTVGIDDDFAALGGHSLLAAELCGRLNDVHAGALRVVEVFTHPTVRQLADLVSERGWRPEA